MLALVRYEVDRALNRLGLATADEVASLQRRVTSLEGALAKADGSDAAPPSAVAPRRSTAGSGPAKKAAKRAPAKAPAKAATARELPRSRQGVEGAKATPSKTAAAASIDAGEVDGDEVHRSGRRQVRAGKDAAAKSTAAKSTAAK